MVGELEGWRVASERPGALPRIKGSALAHGCGRGGRVVLRLARAAVISTGYRGQRDAVLQLVQPDLEELVLLRASLPAQHSVSTHVRLQRTV